MSTRPIVAALALILSTHASAAHPEASWITDYAKAKATARAAGKPIFLVFR
jgi:hypothetical protein